MPRNQRLDSAVGQQLALVVTTFVTQICYLRGVISIVCRFNKNSIGADVLLLSASLPSNRASCSVTDASP